MAKISTPGRGQPLDLSYIYQIVDAINNLSNELSPVTAKYTSVNINNDPQNFQTVRTSDARIIGGYTKVVNGSSTTSGTEVVFEYKFSNFAYPPIVTATANTSGTSSTNASKDVAVVITEVTTSLVTGIVKFNTIGMSSVGVNIIAVGIPV